jgi:two-component system NtrC family response regulator
MPKVLVVENQERDAERLRALLAADGYEVVVCDSGAAAEEAVRQADEPFPLALVLWEIPGPPFGSELIGRWRLLWSRMRVVVVSSSLDAGLATRAFGLGARDFLEKPLDAARLRRCLRKFAAQQDPLAPLVEKIRNAPLGERNERLIGESPSFIATLRQTAKAIEHGEAHVLLLGESGTGKELLAHAIHQLGPHSDQPWFPVNIAETPATLIESALFGHEKGAYTDARERRVGLLESSQSGTLFLDEIGELDQQVQGKLLRVVQERQFRRLGGTATSRFRARLVCATNRDLAQKVTQGEFRRDLFHRISEITIHVPPLRERPGDIDLLSKHFLNLYRRERPLRFTQESISVLRSYSFPGNVRELDKVIKAAAIECEGDEIEPAHMPLPTMATFLGRDRAEQGRTTDVKPDQPSPVESVPQPSCAPAGKGVVGDKERTAADQAAKQIESPHADVLAELSAALPPAWVDLPYRKVIRSALHAIDRVYFQKKLRRSRYKVARAAKAAGMDPKTFRKHWQESGLRPLTGDEEHDGV